MFLTTCSVYVTRYILPNQSYHILDFWYIIISVSWLLFSFYWSSLVLCFCFMIFTLKFRNLSVCACVWSKVWLNWCMLSEQFCCEAKSMLEHSLLVCYLLVVSTDYPVCQHILTWIVMSCGYLGSMVFMSILDPIMLFKIWIWWDSHFLDRTP